MSMTHQEQARALFQQGYNCAQSVLGVYAAELGLPLETAMALASSFGGGMGRMREVCGAVSGMFLAAGLKFGGYGPTDHAGKKTHYARIQELARRFQAETGSIICRELLGLGAGKEDPTPALRTPAYYQKRPCGDLVVLATRIFDDYCVQQATETP